MTLSELISHSYENRDEIKISDSCACFDCYETFKSSEIQLWCDSDDPNDEDPGGMRKDDKGFPGRTAVCPKCENTSILGDACGVVLTKDLLINLNEYWKGSVQ